MLTTGFNHVAIITKDADRLLEFYGAVFGAEKSVELAGPPGEKFRLRRSGGDFSHAARLTSS